MKRVFLASLTAVFLASGTAISTAQADDPSAPTYSFSVTGATDYIFRGVSQTENASAIFGKAGVSYDRFYAAAGMENVNFHNGIDAEYDLSAGWAPSAAGFNFDIGAIRYGYIDQPTHVDIDTTEIRGSVSRGFGPVTAGVAVNYAIDYFGTKDNGTYFEGNLAYAITDKLSASGAAGRQTISAGGDYTTWNAGASYVLTKNFAVDLRYYDTDEHDFGKRYKSHFVAAIKASL